MGPSLGSLAAEAEAAGCAIAKDMNGYGRVMRGVGFQ